MAAPTSKTLHDWMLTQCDLVPNGSATAKTLDYSLKRWVALTRYLGDGAVPIDNNPVENQIRPWALARSNWLFVGSLRSGIRAAAIMSCPRVHLWTRLGLWLRATLAIEAPGWTHS